MTLDSVDATQFRNLSLRFFLAVPFIAAVPVAAWFFFRSLGVTTSHAGAAFGALGWLIALQLRLPIATIAKKMPPARLMLVLILASGPCEELVRFLLVLLTGRTTFWAASAGQGWAAVEVLYASSAGPSR